jgi:hypothetical protein
MAKLIHRRIPVIIVGANLSSLALFSRLVRKVVRLSKVEFMERAPRSSLDFLRRYHCVVLLISVFGFVDERRESCWEMEIFRLSPSRNPALYLLLLTPYYFPLNPATVGGKVPRDCRVPSITPSRGRTPIN